MSAGQDRRAFPQTHHAVLTVLGCLAASGALLAWGVSRGLGEPDTASAIGLGAVLAGCLWLAVAAIRRHRAAAAAVSAPYLTRHAGLIFGLGGWSATTWFMVRGQEPPLGTAAAEFHLWLFLFLGGIVLPMWLWGGTLWHRGVRRGLGHDAAKDRRDEK